MDIINKHYWNLKSGNYDGVDVMHGYLAIKKVQELEAKIKRLKDDESQQYKSKYIKLLKLISAPKKV